MHYEADSIKIIGLSAVVPAQYEDNIEDASNDKKLQKLIKMTGIYKRHTLDLNKHRLVDMSVTACREVITKSSIDKSKIKAIVYITQKPEFTGPATAFLVQKELDIGKDCIVFDVNLGCSGFVAGLQIASSLMNGFADGDIALLINAESMSSVQRENPNDVYLFGDASTAVLLRKDESYNGKFFSEYYSDGNRYDAIIQKSQNSPCVMDGQAVFEFSVYEVSEYIKRFLENHSLTDDSIDHIVFHQAQKFIIDHVAVNAKLDKNKMLYSLDEYGNTSGASVPLSICNNKDKLKEHGRYLLSGFGVGLAWGITYIEIDSDCVYGVSFFV